MRTIYFRSYTDHWAAGQYLLTKYFEKLNIISKVIYSIEGIKDSIILFVSPQYANEATEAKKHGNICIFNPLDSYTIEENRPEIINEFDGAILPTEARCKRIKIPAKCIRVFYNELHRNGRKQHKDFTLAYAGHDSQLLYGNLIPNLNIIDFTQANNYSCHYSIRKQKSLQAYYKPNSKITTAAACGSNIVTTKDICTAELFGNDYPFYTYDDLDSVLEMVKFAKDSFGSKTWNIGLEYMNMLYYRTSPEAIANDYLSFLREF